MKEIVRGVLEGNNVGWLNWSRLKRLMQNENLRAQVISQLYPQDNAVTGGLHRRRGECLANQGFSQDFRIRCPKIHIWGELGVQFLFIPLHYTQKIWILGCPKSAIGCPKDRHPDPDTSLAKGVLQTQILVGMKQILTTKCNILEVNSLFATFADLHVRKFAKFANLHSYTHAYIVHFILLNEAITIMIVSGSHCPHALLIWLFGISIRFTGKKIQGVENSTSKMVPKFQCASK